MKKIQLLLTTTLTITDLDLVNKGVVIYTWGNVSGISDDRKYMVIKPSSVDYDGMSPEDMVVRLQLENV